MLHLLSLSGTEPVSTAEAKVAARVDNDLGATSSLDDFIAGAISTARAQAEQITGRRYRACVMRAQFTDWPDADEAIHVHAPSACAISYWTGSSWATLAGGAFAFYPLDPGGTGIAPAYGTSWPTLGNIAGGPRVRVDLTCGPTGADGELPVPECVKNYIKSCVAGWVNNGDFHSQKQLVANDLLAYALDSERLWA